MKSIINTEHAPKAVGPYSQGVILGKLVFTSGQIPLDPRSMSIVEGGIKEQTYQSLMNLKAVLEHAGASLNSVVKTTCFLANMEDFSSFNDIYMTFFDPAAAPARSCIQAGKLPKDALVEIEAIAYI